MTQQVPLPHPTPLSQPHWDALRRHELTAQQCQACGRWAFPPRTLCNNCLSDKLEWRPSSGRGVVDSFTIVHRPPTPAFDVPYVVVIVRVDEGWHLLSNLVGCDPDDVKIDMPVQVSFREITPEVTLPLFEPLQK